MEKVDFRVKGVDLIKEKYGHENEVQIACLRYWQFESLLLTFHVLILKLTFLLTHNPLGGTLLAKSFFVSVLGIIYTKIF